MTEGLKETPAVLKPARRKRHAEPQIVSGEVMPKKKKPAIQKATWKKVIIIAVSLYIGWSLSKINDQAQELRDLKALINLGVNKTADPSSYYGEKPEAGALNAL